MRIRFRPATRSSSAQQPRPTSPAKGWAAALALWSGAGAAAALYLDDGATRALLPALLALAAVIGIWRAWAHLGVVAGVLAFATYALFLVVRQDPTASGVHVSLQPELARAAAPLLIVAALGFIGTGLIADALGESAEREELERRRDKRVLDELTPTVHESGVMKRGHANRVIGDEIVRARRYGHGVCLAMVSIAGWEQEIEERGEQAEQELVDIAAAIKRVLRPEDTVAMDRPGRLLVLLPHTDLPGGHAAVIKIRETVKKRTGREAQAGLAEFPNDAADPVQLLTEATIALDFAQRSELGVASRTLLSDEDPRTAGGSPRML
ncbi:MAG: diguanylate cyclase [Chloroflexi bacterium]|nr:diguanylate cyclase [Chloroflexota bacterium]